MAGKRGTTQERLERQLSMVPEAGCWLFTGNLDHKGYGSMRIPIAVGKYLTVRTHRLAWEIYRGKIPAGMHVCHKCDIPCCVNPDHLFLGTRADNSHDSWKKGRAWLPWMREHIPLTPDQIAEIRAAPQFRGVCRMLAKKLGCSAVQVGKIRRGACWTGTL